MSGNPSTPQVSVIVVNWNTKGYLRRCLESIPNAVREWSYEVIVVDNASSDTSSEMVRREFPWVQLIASVENLGYSRGNNLGISHSCGEFVALINPDVVLSEGSLTGLVNFLKSHPKVGLVGPQSLDSNGKPHNYKLHSPSLLNALLAFPCVAHVTRFFRRLSRKEPTQIDKPVECDRVHGSCMVMPRQALDAIGLVPGETFVYGEEIIIGHLLRQKGYEVWYNPLVQVIHFDGASTKSRWADWEKAAAIRIGIVSAFRRMHAKPHYLSWNLVLLVSALLRFLSSLFRSSRERSVQAAFLRIHLLALLGKDPRALSALVSTHYPAIPSDQAYEDGLTIGESASSDLGNA